MKSINISDAEWQVMTVLWERSPMTASDVVAALEGRSRWKTRTIRTLLDRLVQKGAVKVLLDGKRLYAPAVSLAACVRNESRSFVERVFGGEPASLLLHLIKETKLTKGEIDKLKKLLSEKGK
jgi:BlaI family penicillinase repressor